LRRSRWAKPFAVALGLSLVAAACGDDDDAATPTDSTAADSGSDTTDGGGAGGEESSFVGCEVTDEGGVDDRSFNQTAFDGMQQAGDEVGFDPVVQESTSAADYEPNIAALLEEDCGIIVTVGFALGDATAAAAEANPDQSFAIVDDTLFDTVNNTDRNFDNVRELTFQTDQAAFLAGYAAAAASETGVVGTYGGRPFPTVTIFMDGFAAGVAMYNADTGEDVQLVGWDPEAQDGLFTGDFENVENGRLTTEQLLDQGADVIMPVAGPVGQGTLEAIRNGGGDELVVWVDSDGCEQLPDDCSLFLTSVQKKIDVAVREITVAAANGEFEAGTYSGTLENEGVDIADFREYEDRVGEEALARIEELRQQIIDTGELPTP
jgi:basic membrane protein A